MSEVTHAQIAAVLRNILQNLDEDLSERTRGQLIFKIEVTRSILDKMVRDLDPTAV